MSLVQQVTTSSQLRSSNAETDIENHTGEENRATYNHKNPDIDTSLSHLNVGFDLHDRRDLLENHYADTIQKHNENKNNKSEARKWDLDKYLATFEGKTVMRMGKETTNARWSTATQVSYFGSKDSLNPVLEALEEAGASPEEVREAYASGYKEYVQQHNEKFVTLPIYHSDIHFDETTPHGHDAIVVKGHTEKGRASDSINNALGEMYGYKSIDPDTGKARQGFAHNQANMVRYREENDKIIFDSIGSKLEALGEAHGLDFNFEFIRTGQTDSVDYREYKKKKDFESEVQETEEQLDIRSNAQKKNSEKHRKRNKELTERERSLDGRESDLTIREGSVIAKEKEQKEKEQKAAERQAELNRKEIAIADKEKRLSHQILEYSNVFDATALAVFKDDPKYAHWVERIEKQRVYSITPDKLTDALADSISRTQQGKRVRPMGDKKFINQQIARQEAENDGPEL